MKYLIQLAACLLVCSLLTAYAAAPRKHPTTPMPNSSGPLYPLKDAPTYTITPLVPAPQFTSTSNVDPRWAEVSELDGYKYYIDKESLKRESPQKILFWLKTVRIFGGKESVAGPYRLNCEERTIGGNYISPESKEEKIFNFVCQENRPMSFSQWQQKRSQQAATNVALGSRWKLVDETIIHKKYIDMEELRRCNVNWFTGVPSCPSAISNGYYYWEKTVYPSSAPTTEDHLLNCSDKTIDSRAIEPDSSNEKIFKFLCHRK